MSEMDEGGSRRGSGTRVKAGWVSEEDLAPAEPEAVDAETAE